MSASGRSHINFRGKRLHHRRASVMKEASEEILHRFKMVKYEEASSVSLTAILRDKLVTLVNEDDPNSMAPFFALEKIRPAFSYKAIGSVKNGVLN
ncbi:MAG: hypothetical protein ACTSUS_10220 [Candidatus Freyarchaeota archaeon]